MNTVKFTIISGFALLLAACSSSPVTVAPPITDVKVKPAQRVKTHPYNVESLESYISSYEPSEHEKLMRKNLALYLAHIDNFGFQSLDVESPELGANELFVLSGYRRPKKNPLRFAYAYYSDERKSMVLVHFGRGELLTRVGNYAPTATLSDEYELSIGLQSFCNKTLDFDGVVNDWRNRLSQLPQSLQEELEWLLSSSFYDSKAFFNPTAFRLGNSSSSNETAQILFDSRVHYINSERYYDWRLNPNWGGYQPEAASVSGCVISDSRLKLIADLIAQ
jgi:hypothetical protein